MGVDYSGSRAVPRLDLGEATLEFTQQQNGAEQDRIRRAEQEKRNHEGHINSWVNTFKEYFDKGLTVDEIKVAMITRSSNTTPGHVLHNPHFLADDVISEIATRTGIPLEDVQAVVDFGKVEHLKDMDRNRKDAEEYQRRKENTKELWIEGDHVRRFVGDYGPVLLKKVVNDLRRSEQ